MGDKKVETGIENPQVDAFEHGYTYFVGYYYIIKECERCLDKKQKYRWLILCILSICLMVGMGKYMKRAACAKMVCGFKADYTYYKRSLSVKDFEQFDYDSTYDELLNIWECQME